MHFDRSSPYMDAEMKRKRARHPRASRAPAQRSPLDSRVRGNDSPLNDNSQISQEEACEKYECGICSIKDGIYLPIFQSIEWDIVMLSH